MDNHTSGMKSDDTIDWDWEQVFNTVGDPIMTSTITSSITSPSTITISGALPSYSITSPYYTDLSSISLNDTLTNHYSGSIELQGEDADIVINGVGLNDRLAAIEARLNILRVNEKLESEWEELAELGRLYREKEAEILEGIKIWDILRK